MASASRIGRKYGIRSHGSDPTSRLARWSRWCSERQGRTRCGSPPARRPGPRGCRMRAGRRRTSVRTGASPFAPPASEPSTKRGSCSLSTTTRPSSTGGMPRDPLIGPSVQRLRGMRPRRKATVTHAVIRAVCGQLIHASEALRIERADHPRVREGSSHACIARAALARSTHRLRACGESRRDTDAPCSIDRSRRAASERGRAGASRPRARSRPVDGGRDRVARAGPL